MADSQAVFSSLPPDQYIVAVDVGGTNMVGAIVNHQGQLVHRQGILSIGDTPPGKRLVDLIGALIRKSGLKPESCVGIGLGVPGVTDERGEIVTLAPALNWHAFNLGGFVRDSLGLPVWVENDVNCFLKGEQSLGSMRDVKNGIGITIGTGIGASLLINGHIYRGSRGAAGEMGYWVLDPFLQAQDFQGHGEFESFAAGPGIAARARRLLQHKTHHSILAQRYGGDLDSITAEDVFQAAHLGDEIACRVVEDTIAVLGAVLANISSVLDLERIVIGGGVVQGGDFFIEAIQKRIAALSPNPPEVVRSLLNSDANILGAALYFLERGK